jgi:hypothetical protein
MEMLLYEAILDVHADNGTYELNEVDFPILMSVSHVINDTEMV